ncbi:unnamed protein product [Amoebophrya sp. A25]|nr:unnamed protein product [Amoebophrya sp. A25]|eukprot:GSA25T00008304001.1
MKCMKAVNQCVGRAIRHKNDWAALLLLDQRYASGRVKEDISSWLRSRFQPMRWDTDTTKQGLRTFFCERWRDS